MPKRRWQGRGEAFKPASGHRTYRHDPRWSGSFKRRDGSDEVVDLSRHEFWEKVVAAIAAKTRSGDSAWARFSRTELAGMVSRSTVLTESARLRVPREWVKAGFMAEAGLWDNDGHSPLGTTALALTLQGYNACRALRDRGLMDAGFALPRPVQMDASSEPQTAKPAVNDPGIVMLNAFGQQQRPARVTTRVTAPQILIDVRTAQALLTESLEVLFAHFEHKLTIDELSSEQLFAEAVKRAKEEARAAK